MVIGGGGISGGCRVLGVVIGEPVALVNLVCIYRTFILGICI